MINTQLVFDKNNIVKALMHYYLFFIYLFVTSLCPILDDLINSDTRINAYISFLISLIFY